MFHSSKYYSVKGGKIVSSTPMGRSTRTQGGSVVSSASQKRGNTEHALSAMNPFLMGAKPNSSMSIASINGSQAELLLTGIMPTDDENLLRKYYRDMYYHDSVCGSTADMMSSLPFSDFSLGGLEQEELDVFNSAISRLNLRNSLPEIALEELVNGSFVGILVYDDNKKNFTDMMPFNMDNVTLHESPLYSMDPEIEIRPSSTQLRNFLEDDSPYFRAQRKGMPHKLLEALNSDSFIADPLTTLFLSRNVFTTRKLGISLFKRCLPIYLLEKTLWRGTLVESAKRLRSMRHAVAGDDIWEPTPDDLNALVAAIQEAEMDPLGGILATRNGVSISEVTNGGDFWKITDTVDSTTPMKLRSMGVSEAFLSGEAIYATAENSMNIFIENQAWFRSMTTHEVFYNKLFPIVAHVNGFLAKGNDASNKTGSRELKSLNDASNYRTPTVHWHKQLHPLSDNDMMDTLQKLEEQGLPVTLRAMAAAGGMSLDSLLTDYVDDQKMRKKLEDIKAKYANLHGGNDPEEGSEAGMEMSRLSNSSRLKRVPLLAREFSESDSEIVAESKTGKKKYVPNQGKAQEIANTAIVRAAKRLKDPEVRKEVSKRTAKKTNNYTGG